VLAESRYAEAASRILGRRCQSTRRIQLRSRPARNEDPRGPLHCRMGDATTRRAFTLIILQAMAEMPRGEYLRVVKAILADDRYAREQWGPHRPRPLFGRRSAHRPNINLGVALSLAASKLDQDRRRVNSYGYPHDRSRFPPLIQIARSNRSACDNKYRLNEAVPWRASAWSHFRSSTIGTGQSRRARSERASIHSEVARTMAERRSPKVRAQLQVGKRRIRAGFG